MICLKLNRFFFGLSRMLHLAEFVWILRSLVLVVFNNFLLIDATHRSKIRSDQKRFFYRINPIPPFIFREHSLSSPLNLKVVFLFYSCMGLPLLEILTSLFLNKMTFKIFIYLRQYSEQDTSSLCINATNHDASQNTKFFIVNFVFLQE